jgi:hypothetical protein
LLLLLVFGASMKNDDCDGWPDAATAPLSDMAMNRCRPSRGRVMVAFTTYSNKVPSSHVTQFAEHLRELPT